MTKRKRNITSKHDRTTTSKSSDILLNSGEDSNESKTSLKQKCLPLGNANYLSGKKVSIPEVNQHCFSFRKLWAFTGPGFLMSIAYLDPGNIESDLRSGSIAKYSLLWVLLCASAIALFLQILAARLGVVTGLHLAEICNKEYRKLPRIVLWLMIEIAIVASDIQEVIGTAIALYIISNRIIPIWVGVIATIVDTFTFLILGQYGLRKLELLFGFSITLMGVSFGYEYVISKPDHLGVLKGMFTPRCETCNYNEFLQGIAIIGAVIMPHNLFLHSALVKSRDVDQSNEAKIKEANMYFFIESTIAVCITFLINVFVVSVFAGGLFKVKNRDLGILCKGFSYENDSIFPENDEYVTADLYTGGIFLACRYGRAAMFIWSVGILASGQSSTITGTYSGQFAMEGFLNWKWPYWIKLFITRCLSITPTFFFAFSKHVEKLTDMNDLMNVVNCVQLPFAVIPIIAFTSNRQIMGEFVNSWYNIVAALSFSFVVVCVNTFFVAHTLIKSEIDYLIMGIIIFLGLMYILFCVYLTIHMVVSMVQVNLSEYKCIKKYVMSSTVGYSGL